MNNIKKIQKLPAILYIDGSKLTFYSSSVKSMVQTTLTPDAYKDMDLLNKEKLLTEISTFITVNKLIPANLMLLLSPSSLFEKDFTEPPSEKTDKDIQTFIEYVPFQNVSSKIIKLPGKVKVVVANKDFCEEVFAAFAKQNFSTAGVVPLSAVTETNPELAKSLDLRAVLAKFESLRQYSVFDTQQAILEAKKVESQKPFKSKRTIALMGTLAGLLIILGVMVFTTFIQPSMVKKVIPTPTPLPQLPTVVPSPTVEASPSAALQSATGSTSSANTLKKEASPTPSK